MTMMSKKSLKKAVMLAVLATSATFMVGGTAFAGEWELVRPVQHGNLVYDFYDGKLDGLVHGNMLTRDPNGITSTMVKDFGLLSGKHTVVSDVKHTAAGLCVDGVNVKKGILDNKAAIKAETARATGKEADLENAIKAETTRATQEEARLDERITTETARLDNRIDKVDEKVDKVGAMAAAIASLRTMGYDPEAPTEFAIGVGQYRDKTGVALGAFHYPNKDFMFNVSVSTAGDEVMAGIGATWKFGRKSVAQREEEARIAKAEEIKAAAKAAKVAAQQKRHAEMLAARGN